MAMFTVLAARVKTGLDPALHSSAKRQTAQATLYRRLIIKRKVIHETIVPADPATPSSSGGSGGYSSSASSSVPSYSAPSPTYYAPAPAPVTRAS